MEINSLIVTRKCPRLACGSSFDGVQCIEEIPLQSRNRPNRIGCSPAAHTGAEQNPHVTGDPIAFVTGGVG